MSDTYAWFGCAYFVYDMWTMYEVHRQKIHDKMRLLQLQRQNTEQSAAMYDKVDEPEAPALKHRNKGRNIAVPATADVQLSDTELTKMLRRLRQVPTEQRPTFLRFCAANPVMMVHHVFLQSFGLFVIVVGIYFMFSIFEQIINIAFTIPVFARFFRRLRLRLCLSDGVLDAVRLYAQHP